MALLVNQAFRYSLKSLQDILVEVCRVQELTFSFYLSIDETLEVIPTHIAKLIDKEATTVAELLDILTRIDPTLPGTLALQVEREIHENTVIASSDDAVKISNDITIQLHESSNLSHEISERQVQLNSLKKQLHDNELNDWARDVVKDFTTDEYAKLSTSSTLKSLLSIKALRARKLEAKKEAILIKSLNASTLPANLEPKAILTHDNRINRLIRLLQQEIDALNNKLAASNELEKTMRLRMASISNAKRYLTTYNNDRGIRNRILEIFCEEKLESERVRQFLEYHKCPSIGSIIKTREIKMQFLGVIRADLENLFSTLSACFVAIEKASNNIDSLNHNTKLFSAKFVKLITDYYNVYTGFLEEVEEYLHLSKQLNHDNQYTLPFKLQIENTGFDFFKPPKLQPRYHPASLEAIFRKELSKDDRNSIEFVSKSDFQVFIEEQTDNEHKTS